MLTLDEISERIKSHKPQCCRMQRTAVLVPLIVNDGQLEMLFEVRALNLKWQPGDVCFPGGHYEDGDESMLQTAIRETTEELGIAAEKVRVLGKIGAFDSPLGMEVHIFAGVLDCLLSELVIDRSEVHECFCVPLAWLENCQPQGAIIEHGTKPGAGFPFDLLQGYCTGWKVRRQYPVLFYNYQERVIWGLTAEVLERFLTVVNQ